MDGFIIPCSLIVRMRRTTSDQNVFGFDSGLHALRSETFF